MKARRLLALSALALAFGCRDETMPTAPSELTPPMDPSAIISDGAHNGGNPDFFFLPPMVPLPRHNANFELGKFNNTLKNSLKIDICELNPEPGNGLPKAATGCARAVKTFAPGSVNLVNLPIRQNGWWNFFGLPPDGFYYALWDTRQSNLSTSKYYRIKVFIAGPPDVLLGIADVDPMANLFQWKYTLTGEVVQLIDNVLLPIPFRVERGGGPALCGGANVCSSMTVTNDNPNGDVQVLPAQGNNGPIAGAVFPDGWLPVGPGLPTSVVVTIASVNTGVNDRAAGTQQFPCHANLPLEQFNGCFKFTTTPALTGAAEGGHQFARPVTVVACYVLHDSEDPREPWAQLWSSGPNEPAHPLVSVSDALVLTAPTEHNCGSNVFTTIGSNYYRSNPLVELASAGWQKLKGGLGRLVGVKTAYAVDLGLGGFTLDFSNVGPALTAHIEPIGSTELGVQAPGGVLTLPVRIVGTEVHNNGDLTTGIGGLPVTFAVDSGSMLPHLAVPEVATPKLVREPTNAGRFNADDAASTGWAAVEWTLPTAPGTYTLTATGPATGGPVTFTATVEPTQPSPFINFENYPPGAGVCDGQGACSVTDEFASRGVVFSFSNPDLTASLCRTIHGPVGEGSNYGVSPPSTDCSGWITGIVTMFFASHPTTVEFTLEGNNLGPPPEGPFPVTALDAQGNSLTVTRSDVITYQDQFDQTFRRETRRVTSELGIASVSVDSNVSIRIIDNLLITP